MALVVMKTDLFGSMNIGNYAKATNRYLIVGGEAGDREVAQLAAALEVESVKVVIRDCRVTAPFFVGNQNGLLISKFVDADTVQLLKMELNDINVEVIDARHTAIGNLIIANDQGAMFSEVLSPKIVETMSDVLDIEPRIGVVAKATYIGSLAVVNNNGCLVSPFAQDEEMESIEEILRVDVERGTINSGVKFISSGLIANDKSAVAGGFTDGSELMKISQALKVV